MGFSKDLVNADGVSVNVSESAGQVVLAASVSKSAGGGEAAGVVSLSASASVSVSATQLLGLLFQLVESKSPAGVVLIEKEVQAAAMAALASA